MVEFRRALEQAKVASEEFLNIVINLIKKGAIEPKVYYFCLNCGSDIFKEVREGDVVKCEMCGDTFVASERHAKIYLILPGGFFRRPQTCIPPQDKSQNS